MTIEWAPTEDAHRGFAAVAQAVETDALRVHVRLRGEPLEDTLVLTDDDAEEGLARPHRVVDHRHDDLVEQRGRARDDVDVPAGDRVVGAGADGDPGFVVAHCW